jgi:hypothetical protein
MIFFKKRLVIINNNKIFACDAYSESQTYYLLQRHSTSCNQYIEDNLPFKVKPTKQSLITSASRTFIVCNTESGHEINVLLKTFLENIVDFGLDIKGYINVGFVFAHSLNEGVHLVNEFEENKYTLKEIIT